jgi:hypothetical protein
MVRASSQPCPLPDVAADPLPFLQQPAPPATHQYHTHKQQQQQPAAAARSWSMPVASETVPFLGSEIARGAFDSSWQQCSAAFADALAEALEPSAVLIMDNETFGGGSSDGCGQAAGGGRRRGVEGSALQQLVRSAVDATFRQHMLPSVAAAVQAAVKTAMQEMAEGLLLPPIVSNVPAAAAGSQN